MKPMLFCHCSVVNIVVSVSFFSSNELVYDNEHLVLFKEQLIFSDGKQNKQQYHDLPL
jgi:hypothetical protein